MKIELILGGKKKSQQVMFATSMIRGKKYLLQIWSQSPFGFGKEKTPWQFSRRKKSGTYGMNLQKFEKVSLRTRRPH